ncbi:D-2-hydroxyacid dehydrogenase [Nocardioides agariphilus]|uniref:D-2-hydroxyacid dehydrogenase n=1 Tax=Nocardioides agariphilus TaxID=433664 RepID=A0A930VQC9_9ACTN|nr:D-2-hydroxyacid dehydrogenase [Nocardioides agariphilus]MBF4768772.1 D-2-hydroxyacid dehydrogenase [Nocardioides agariphilus]
MRRIVVLGRTAADRPPYLEELAGRVHLDYCDSESLARALPGAEALFLWDFFSSSLEKAWGSASDLRWVHVSAAGVDTLLFPELVESPVIVTNARGVFDRPIAEYVLAALLAVAKDLRATYELQARREWRHRETQDLRGSRALVVGTGAIGREIARLLSAVGVEVRGAGRTERPDDPDFGHVVSSADLNQHVGWADDVIAVAPLNDSTRGMFDRDTFAAMKNSAHFVNVGRGGLVVEADLIGALERGDIAHATLDVVAEEPLRAQSPLWTMDGVTITAHMSGDTHGWRERLARQFVDNAVAWLEGRSLDHVVDKSGASGGSRVGDGA